MRKKQIIATCVLLLVAFLVVFPPLASGSVTVALSSSSSVPAEHVYVTIETISAHRADTREPSGWFLVSNRSVRVDLAVANLSQAIGLGSLSLGEYDTIKLKITNATMVVNNTFKNLQLGYEDFTVSVSFFIQLGSKVSVLLSVISDIEEETGGGPTLTLTFSATPTSST